MKSGELIWIGEKKTTLRLELEKRYGLIVVRSGKQALEVAQACLPQAIIIDQDGLKSSGARLCNTLRRVLGDGVLLLTIGAEDTLADHKHLNNPSPRQFVMALNRLSRAAESQWVACGAFALDEGGGRLRVEGREIRLSPKKARLLAVLFDRPNQVVERAQLMQEVWQTQYVGDTRTLNVHIRWVRQVLAEAKKPLSLETVRGLGYRLRVGEEGEEA